MTDQDKGAGIDDKLTIFELLLFAFLLIIASLSAVAFLRLAHDNPVFPVGESYYNLRIAEAIRADPFLAQDELQGKPYHQNPYHYILAAMISASSSDVVSLMLPIALGLASALLFYLLLVLLGFDEKKAVFSLVLLSLSPAFIILFTTLSLTGFAVFLSLLSLVLLFDHKRSVLQRDTEVFIGIMILLILAMTSLAAFVITMLLLFTFTLMMKRRLRVFMLALLLFMLLLIPLIMFSSYPLESMKRAGFHAFEVKSMFSVFGAPLGFGIFFLMLFITGFLVIWDSDYERRLFHLAALLLVILAFFNSVALAYASFLIVIYCVIAIYYLFNRHWELQIVKTGTLLLVVCAMIFSGLNQITVLANSEPSKELRDALFSFRGLEPGAVLTDSDYGFLVEFYSGQRAFTDANSFIFDDYKELKDTEAALLNFSRLKEAEPVLNQSGVRYILITPRMKEIIWEDREEKLWFLLRHSESFGIKFSQTGIDAWEYIGSD
ncbi:MAG: hypothetical protein V1866_03005 [archaeon]